MAFYTPVTCDTSVHIPEGLLTLYGIYTLASLLTFLLWELINRQSTASAPKACALVV